MPSGRRQLPTHYEALLRASWWLVGGIVVAATVIRFSVGEDFTDALIIGGAIVIGVGLGIERWVSSITRDSDPIILTTRQGVRYAWPWMLAGAVTILLGLI